MNEPLFIHARGALKLKFLVCHTFETFQGKKERFYSDFSFFCSKEYFFKVFSAYRQTDKFDQF